MNNHRIFYTIEAVVVLDVLSLWYIEQELFVDNVDKQSELFDSIRNDIEENHRQNANEFDRLTMVRTMTKKNLVRLNVHLTVVQNFFFVDDAFEMMLNENKTMMNEILSNNFVLTKPSAEVIRLVMFDDRFILKENNK